MTFLWWHWLVLGLLLVVFELATPGGFYIIFFGIGALLVGVMAAMGIGPLWVQVALFPLLSIVGLALFRSRLLKLTQIDPQTPAVDTLVGEIGTISEVVAPGAVGKVELRGASWSARNDSPMALTPGTRFKVLRVEGLMLHVAPEGVRS